MKYKELRIYVLIVACIAFCLQGGAVTMMSAKASASTAAVTNTMASSQKVQQRLTIGLQGTWQSSLGACQLPGTTDENKLGGGEHPTNVTSQLTRLYPYKGVVTYEREVEIPAAMEGRQMMLVLERTKPTTLWIDGDSIGSIRKLYGFHEYALPSLKAGVHRVKIAVDNRDEAVPSGVHGSHAWTDATQTNWNGILGRMEIVALPQAYIADLQLYPDAERKEVKVKMSIVAAKAGKYAVSLERNVYADEAGADGTMTQTLALKKAGRHDIEITMPMGGKAHLWSEFHPDLYTLTARLTGKQSEDTQSRTFGLRKFTTEGTQFVINGNKTFLRGTHDACVFPLTAYSPTDVDAWRRLFTIAKQYGINHYRFHSYTPTEAAFTAADEIGVYLHAELPMWGTIDSTTVALNEFLFAEGEDALHCFGNHPSFVSFGLGNELWGDNDLMARWIDEYRAQDPRHLYNQGSNNDLGFRGPKWKMDAEGRRVPAEDFYTTCRVGGGEGFTTHARTSFSFADADHGGILNWNRPSTRADFSNVVALCPVPIVSHETCQFQIYPDYRELPKYTGVLYPYNLEIFRDRLKENGLTPQIDAFHEATGKWVVDCYKADMEYCLRTPGFGGYQLLDLKDYPGQGSALCGILDAFMDSKGIVTAEDFRGWNAPVVAFAEMDTYCWRNDETLAIDLAISNYTEGDYEAPLTWTLSSINNDGNGNGLFREQGEVKTLSVKQGAVSKVGRIALPLNGITKSTQLRLELKTGDYHNYYNLWVYAPQVDVMPVATKTKGKATQAVAAQGKAVNIILNADTLDDATVAELEKGATVLLTPRLASIAGQSVEGLFTPDYWNYAMFKTISENNNRPVSPGTLGMLMNPRHPLFDAFPTEGRSNWQWWSIALNSRPLILNALPHDYLPVIQTVDNVERNHKLGILMEFKVGKGKLLLATTDLNAISQYTEGAAYADALRRYARSAAFNPTTEITPDALKTLLYSETKVRDIQGVKNLTNYKNESE